MSSEQRNLVEKTFVIEDLAAFAWSGTGRELKTLPGVRRGDILALIAAEGIDIPVNGSWAQDPVRYPRYPTEVLGRMVTLLVPAEFEIASRKASAGFQTALGALTGVRPVTKPIVRRELYILVWLKTLGDLAGLLGTSKDEIVSLCATHDIPRPNLTYFKGATLPARDPLPAGFEGAIFEVPAELDLGLLIGDIAGADWKSALDARLREEYENRKAANRAALSKSHEILAERRKEADGRAELRATQLSTHLENSGHELQPFSFRELYSMARSLPTKELAVFFRINRQTMIDRFQKAGVPMPDNADARRRAAGRPLVHPKFSRSKLEEQIYLPVPKNFDFLSIRKTEWYQSTHAAIGGEADTRAMARNELFLLCWSLPWNQVCEVVGWSPLKVATACEEHGIPRPRFNHFRLADEVRPAFQDIAPGPNVEVLEAVPLALDVVALLANDGHQISLHDAFERRHTLLRARSRIVHLEVKQKYSDSIRGVPKTRRPPNPEGFRQELEQTHNLDWIASTLITDWYADNEFAASEYPPSTLSEGLDVLGLSRAADWSLFVDILKDYNFTIMARRLLAEGHDAEKTASIAFGLGELAAYVGTRTDHLKQLMSRVPSATANTDPRNNPIAISSGDPVTVVSAMPAPSASAPVDEDLEKVTRLIETMKSYDGKRDWLYYRDLSLFKLIQLGGLPIATALGLLYDNDMLRTGIARLQNGEAEGGTVALSDAFLESAKKYLDLRPVVEGGHFFVSQKSGKISRTMGYEIINKWERKLAPV